MPQADVVPVVPALRAVVPGLRRGQVVAVGAEVTLMLALVAGASASGAWCALVGLPEFGVEAAMGLGVDIDRVVVVADPGEGQWMSAAAALLGAFDVVLISLAVPPAASMARRIEALARRHRSVLVVAGEWPGAQTRLRVTSSVWTGLRAGRGYLQGRRVRIEASGRGASARPRSGWLWLPGPQGEIAVADLEVLETSA